MKEYFGDLYFERSTGERVLLAKNVDREETYPVINKFLDDHKYKSHYVRSWEQGGELWFDVGSWSEFFVLVDKEACNLNEKRMERKN